MKKSINKLMKKLKTSLVVILTLILIMELTSCTTYPRNNIEWLEVPDTIVNDKSVVELENDTVKMPYWYWLKLELYIITTEANKEKLK